jgi:hypothetical protein
MKDLLMGWVGKTIKLIQTNGMAPRDNPFLASWRPEFLKMGQLGGSPKIVGFATGPALSETLHDHHPD